MDLSITVVEITILIAIYISTNKLKPNANASRTALCQIDEHNFIILSTTMIPDQNNNEDYRVAHGINYNTMGAIFLNYGCIFGVNLDGGGSQSHVYKKNNGTYYRYYDSGQVTVNASTKSTYGLEREITDQLYFVEQ